MTPLVTMNGDVLTDFSFKPGDVVWCNLDPVKGTEQGRYRPMIVLTHETHNRLTKRATCVTITTRIRGWDTEIGIASLSKPCVAQIDQTTTVDLAARGATFKGEQVTEKELDDVRQALKKFLML